MLSISKEELPQHHLQMAQDDKFYSKLLSKDTSSSSSSSSTSSSSFRVYYGVAPASVPFLWESQPGTSKYSTTINPSTTSLLPPLTPPPSYYTNQKTNIITKKSSSYNLFKAMLPKLTLKKHPSSLSFASSSPSSLSSMSTSSSMTSSLSLFSSTSSRSHSRFSSARMSSFSSLAEDHYQDDQLKEIPLTSSSLCFPVRIQHRNGHDHRRGCVKKSFLSILGHHRSSQVIA